MRPHSPPAESHSFVGMARETAAMPPALILTTLVRRKEKRKKDKFYIYLDVTHTHTGWPCPLLNCFIVTLLIAWLSFLDAVITKHHQGPKATTPLSSAPCRCCRSQLEKDHGFIRPILLRIHHGTSAMFRIRNIQKRESCWAFIEKKTPWTRSNFNFGKHVQYISTGEGLRTLLA